MRNESIRELLASRQGVQDQVFQRRDLVGRSCDVDELLSFAGSGILRALLKQVLENIGDTEDCIAVLGVCKRIVPSSVIRKEGSVP